MVNGIKLIIINKKKEWEGKLALAKSRTSNTKKILLLRELRGSVILLALKMILS